MKSFLSAFIIGVGILTVGSTSVLAQDRSPEARRIGGGFRPEPMREDYLGSTGLVGKWSVETREIYVGARRGEYRGITLRARDDDFQVQTVVVYFANGGSRRFDNFTLSENQSYRIDFGGRGRYIDTVVVEGKTADAFGSKAQLEVFGMRR